ncbi:MAG TPA: amino acid ABC transporter permease [Pseudoflavonifractor sp.]|nr:amino acid ABC transporter permease [Pseudoflavonifractor sp.]
MFERMVRLWQTYDTVFLEGLWGTLWLSAVSVLTATVVGGLLAAMKLSKVKLLDLLVNLFMLVIRGTPILLQLYFFWLWLPQIVPFALSDTQCIVVALIVNASAYVAEVIRAGVQSVDIGQTEAAKSLGMSSPHVLTHIVAPQAVKSILPALGNQYIMMIKQTSLASVFFVQELMTSYKTVQSATFLSLPSLAIVGVIYLVVTTVLTQALDLFERRLKRSERN